MHLQCYKPVFYDVDDTLVMWSVRTSHPDAIDIFDGIGSVTVVPHKHHINMLKRHHAEGRTVVVWSAGGSEWARQVVEGLGLEEYVNLTIGKPEDYCDDLGINGLVYGNNLYKEFKDEGE